MRSLAAVVFLLPGITMANSWCEGFAAGFENGYCYRDEYCLPGPVVCPQMETLSSDEIDGYMRGLKDGAADGKQKQREWI